MKKKYLWIGIPILIVLLVGAMLLGGYNSLVKSDVNVEGKYAQIENRLQERHDKIGQILGVVSGLQEHAENIYNAITQARSQYLEATTMEDLVAADAAEALAFSNFLVVFEQNPNITATSGFMTLIYEISEMESGLSRARKDYNDAVQDYNSSVRRFPKMIYASIFGFEKKYQYWKMANGAEEVPNIQF